MSNHKEWRKENTLTAPSDRDRENRFQLEQGVPELTEEEVSLAMRELNDTSFVEKFPAVERKFADPEITMQKYGLISFVPAKGATPNDKGVFGFAKLRGNFDTITEANERAEFIIRNVDSYHQIYHTYVGRPFPITNSSDYSKEVEKIDLQQQVKETMSDDIKRKREKEQREIEEIQKQEQELLEDVKKEEEPTDDRYTTLRVKKAQLTWTYLETVKKVKDMVTLIAKARHEIEILDDKHPELYKNYMDKYLESRRRAGLPNDEKSMETTFLKYLVEDATLPEVDKEYETLYGK